MNALFLNSVGTAGSDGRSQVVLTSSSAPVIDNML
jgi:hypothetical protein